MLQLNNLSLRRGGRLLLDSANLRIYPKWKVGMIGANGTGKSSLFQLILGRLSSDQGEYQLPSEWTIAHVAQDTPPTERSALDYVLDGDQELRYLHTEIDKCTDNNRIANLHAQLENIEGYTAESRAIKLLRGLGFAVGDESKAVNKFSGGWRMRLNLAQALMCRSELLLLDEPTNHLDLDAILWLQQWLTQYSGTLLLISHDREFLDHTVTHIAHLHQHNLNLYSGNYSDFEQTVAQETLQQKAAYNQQQQKIQELTRFVDRFRAKATKAKQAQSRLKTLERMARIPPVHMTQGFDFTFNNPERLPDPLLKLDDVAIGYNGHSLIKNVNLNLHPGDRYGLIGPNGAGKSTLIKLFANQLLPIKGQRIASPYLVTGYFAQHQIEQIDPDASPLTHLRRINPDASEQSLRDHLGMFSFSNDVALGKTGHFSGGEKARLVFAMLCYRKPNLLLLDEPTNHLDLDMRRALAMALNQYPGAVVLISHDRYLINSICDNTLLINDGKAEPFDGDQSDYARWLVRRSNPGNTRDKRERSSTVSVTPDVMTAKEKRRQAALRREQLKSLVNDVKYQEQKLERLNAEKKEIMRMLSDTSVYNTDQSERLKKLLEKQANLEKALKTTESAWINASEKLEQADQ